MSFKLLQRNHSPKKIQNMFNIIEISKSMEPNKVIHNFKNSENIYICISYDFSKFKGFKKIKV